ncbi:MAG: hypothetical protein AAGF04_00270 [Chlamydiota bacterium]
MGGGCQLRAIWLFWGGFLWIILIIAFSHAIHAGFAPFCNPYIKECINITQTGIHSPVAFIYPFVTIGGTASIALIVSHYLASLTSSCIPQIAVYVGILGAVFLSLQEYLIDPNVGVLGHLLCMHIFSIATGISLVTVTAYLQKLFPTEQRLRIATLLTVIVILAANPSNFNDKVQAWWLVSLVIVWFLSFYPAFAPHKLTVLREELTPQKQGAFLLKSSAT